VELLDIEAVARLLGIEINYVDDLDDLDVSSGYATSTRLAGILDRDSRRISISNRFSMAEMRFTAAHEIGHWRLHDDLKMHRDRPIDLESASPRMPRETEADWFACALLMPRRLVEREARARFIDLPFRFNDASSYWLTSNPADLVDARSARSLGRWPLLGRSTMNISLPWP
jgi:predicted transcriptional regulator